MILWMCLCITQQIPWPKTEIDSIRRGLNHKVLQDVRLLWNTHAFGKRGNTIFGGSEFNYCMILRCLAWAGMHCHDSTDLVLGFSRPEQDVAQVPPKSATSTISYAISIWFIYIYNYICDWYITCYTTIPTIPTIDSLESTGRWQIFIPWPCWRVVLKQSWNLQRRSRNPRKAPLGCCKGDGSFAFV